MWQLGKSQGKIRERRHPRPLSMHRKRRRRGKAENEQEQSWERAGEGLCKAAVVRKRHEDAWSSGKLCRGALLDFQVEKKSFSCLKPQCSGAVCEQATRYCLRNGNRSACAPDEGLMSGREEVHSALCSGLGSHWIASTGTAPWRNHRPTGQDRKQRTR